MAKLIYSALMSLDGYIAAKMVTSTGPSRTKQCTAFVNELVRPVGTHLYGRGMYEVMAAWQTLPTHEQPSFIANFANIWRTADKVVDSKTLKAASTPRTRIEQHFEPGAASLLLECMIELALQVRKIR
jgi:dihydrofolate reductase